MREDQEPYGLGLPITTNNGKIAGAKKRKALEERMDEIERLARLRQRLTNAGDVAGLLKLADEYEEAGMEQTARVIRNEVG